MKELSVGVVGAGLMGAGIAEVAARAGSAVVLVDVDPAAVAKGRARIEKNVRKSADKGQLSADDAEAVVTRVTAASAYEALGGCDLIIEAVYEDIAVKKDTFRKLDAIALPRALLATNTSGLSITEISAVTRRPENVIGLHFFYPAPRMALVEMTRGLATSDSTFQTAQQFVDAIGKKAILAPDYPGFIVNRILLPMINEAVFCVMEGAKPEDVDAGMTLGCNFPMGPLTLADFVGLDVALATITGLYENLRDSKYRPCPLLVQMVKAGWLGRKTGRGFYKYS